MVDIIKQQEEETKTYIRKIMADHRKILRAVESRNAMAAKRAMKRHLDFAEKTLIGVADSGTPSGNLRRGGCPIL